MLLKKSRQNTFVRELVGVSSSVVILNTFVKSFATEAHVVPAEKLSSMRFPAVAVAPFSNHLWRVVHSHQLASIHAIGPKHVDIHKFNINAIWTILALNVLTWFRRHACVGNQCLRTSPVGLTVQIVVSHVGDVFDVVFTFVRSCAIVLENARMLDLLVRTPVARKRPLLVAATFVLSLATLLILARKTNLARLR
jgi:hypothetical protein